MVQDRPSRRIAADYGLAYGAIHRHRNNHLPAAIRAAAAEAVQRADVAHTVADTTIAPAPVCEAVEAAPVAPETVPVRTRQRTRNIQLTDTPPAPPVSPAPAGQAGSVHTVTGWRLQPVCQRNRLARTGNGDLGRCRTGPGRQDGPHGYQGGAWRP